jgi:prepilin-type N-terminal cleavage/methylation domain-containing protein
MRRASHSSRGYSMVELLMVLAILGIMAIVGFTMLGDRGSGAVRGVMDELEGTLMSAQKLAVATGQDVTIATQGDWDAAAGNKLILAQATGMTPTAAVANGQTTSNSFKLAVTGAGLSREHAYAGVVTGASAWWAAAMGVAPNGKRNDDVTTVEPFLDQTGFTGILGNTATNLFQGGAAIKSVSISGSNKRFNNTFWIEVVSLRQGFAAAGGAMGVLVVLANGGTVYKFYNPGVINGNGKWRRI